ncbi:MAG: N-acetyl-alpha-D-glucosaminyl L-malate synthase BshA [Planctomycetota bacterium]
MNIGVLCHPTYGGSGVVASELALSLAGNGHTVHVFSHAVPPRLASSSVPVQMHVSQGLPYPLFASTPHDLAITSSVLSVHEREGLDILHAHYALPHAVSAILARSAAEKDRRRPAPKVVTTLHGTDITIVGSDPSYAPLTQFLISASDAATAVSESLAQDTRRHFCFDNEPDCRIEVIPNFVDLNRFRVTEKPRDRSAPLRAVHVSNFRAVKRVPWLVEAFARASSGTKATLTLIGDGPEQAATRERVETLGISDRVCFLGERNTLPKLLADTDLFLLASTEESFGLSALEAMACGVPVVATNVGGVPEVVTHNETGLLVGPDDLEGFAAAIATLAQNRELLASMGSTARADVEERFDKNIVVARYEELYASVLRGEPGSSSD